MMHAAGENFLDVVPETLRKKNNTYIVSATQVSPICWLVASCAHSNGNIMGLSQQLGAP